jgi:hypothetical protein
VVVVVVVPVPTLIREDQEAVQVLTLQAREAEILEKVIRAEVQAHSMLQAVVVLVVQVVLLLVTVVLVAQEALGQ